MLLLVALSAFEGLSVAAALPQVAASLGHVEMLPWVITSYLLTAGVSTVAAGSLIDRIGIAKVFRGSVILLIIGGVLAGLAPSMATLVLARAIHGAGAGAVNAVGLSAVGLVFPRHLIGRAFAANTNVWGAMSVGGPALASVLLTFASWRWIFLVNLPLGAIALVAGWNALPPPAHEGRGAALRTVDLGLLAGFTFFVLFAVDALDGRSLLALGAAVVCGIAVVRRNRGREDAVIAPRHALDAPLGPLAWGIALMLMAGIGVQTFVPLFVSAGHGGGTALTAWSVVFFVLGWTGGANIVSRLSERVSPLNVMLGGTVLLSCALFAIAGIAASGAPLPALFVLLVLAGSGIGGSTNAGLTLLRDLVTDDELGRATAAHQFLRNLGFAMGNALVGSVLLFVVGTLMGDVERIREVLGRADGVPLNAEISAAVQTGFAVAALVSAVVCLGALAPLWRVRQHIRQA
ncbi:MFS transporter [Enhygromyxa salina]|uniref:MFS transporter n=1 Tax=Enhygromyxa salina TaxID=215803 RepID=UPI0013FCFA6F|nr:MFS transporter [Enhygromyxa salina]